MFSGQRNNSGPAKVVRTVGAEGRFVVEDGVPGRNQTADNPTPAPAARLSAEDLSAASVHQETARP